MDFELTTRLRDHEFDFLLGVCLRCQMSRKRYKDSGRPRCVGHPPDKPERQTIAAGDGAPAAT
jgi:hypothetical protein